MANIVEKNYAYIDTFGADVRIWSGDGKLLSITTVCVGAAEMAHFKNDKGHTVFVTGGLTSLVDHFCPARPIRVWGLTFDDTASTMEAGDFLVIHFA